MENRECGHSNGASGDRKQRANRACGGKYVVENPTTLAFENVRRAFDGEADRLGLKGVDDVTAMVKEIRAKRRDKR
jgi:hypothetical protein